MNKCQLVAGLSSALGALALLAVFVIVLLGRKVRRPFQKSKVKVRKKLKTDFNDFL